MIVSSPDDYRAAAQRRLPRFLFDYIDGGANAEETLRRNVSDMQAIELRQRVLKGTAEIDLSTSLFGEKLALPLALAPVGLTGMYARRGEVQAAKAAESAGIAYSLSTVSVCPIEEVVPASDRPIWFQLYVLKDRAFMKSALERALAAGVKTLVFTVDMPVPGSRYRDAHSGMSGSNANIRRMLQAITHPHWAISVGLGGRPHDLGNISAYRRQRTKLVDYMGWLAENFDPDISWKDLEWIRDFWPGNLIIKGILDPDDVEDAIRLGADGLVVSNHGGRQLDGVSSSIRVLSDIVGAADKRTKVLVDSGFRSGLDVVRALCLGADAVMLGRSYIYALAAGGQTAVENLLDLYAKEMRVAMTLMGAQSVTDLTTEHIKFDH
ncbi:FMN-dependent L-lactate dehydrogenase LldD [uncultured Hyphomonas sp.]|jgi:L-lactate dehydrogenase (cytochrome)|uniref:FMN-dependent L-lactate dehydrogenase LldD n=1 Tax=uncultured Hyphomonas sp. TaxID=225298 RepID=UPI000C3F8CBD|nr:alpha-hydroxy-acid oxidizing enzyme [Hyphomonadaceae bacterium]|tara:strand:+ start:26399 stop:27538 length:1140 start_codon:yes stop_codon:yes gene_type:complete